MGAEMIDASKVERFNDAIQRLDQTPLSTIFVRESDYLALAEERDGLLKLLLEGVVLINNNAAHTVSRRDDCRQGCGCNDRRPN